MTDLEDWKARALKAEGEVERLTMERDEAYLSLNSRAALIDALEAEVSRLSASRGEVDGWRPSREAIIAALRGVDGLSGHFVPSDRGARYDIYASVVLDLLSALPPLDEGKGKEAALVSSERTGTPAPPTPGAGLAGKGAP